MKKAVMYLLMFYKKHISPSLELSLGHSCRFKPTCSEYMHDAVEKYGAFRGMVIGIKRILRCHPLSKGGWDPVQ